MTKLWQTNRAFIVFIVLCLITLPAFSAKPGDRFSVATGNWNSTSTWSATPGGPPGASVPGKNDDAYLENGYTVTVTADASISNVIFTGTNAGLTVNSGFTLSVKFSIVVQNEVSADVVSTISGSGTIECNDVDIGSATNPPPSSGASLFTHKLISGIANFNISGDVTINSYFGTVSNRRNGSMNIESGIVTVNGPNSTISTNNQNAINVSTITMSTGAQSGTLVISGRANAFSISAIGSSNFSFDGASSLVVYNKTNTQTVYPTAYHNLTLSGSGSKTLSGATVNGTLSMEGTATATGTTPGFSPASALQYKGTTAQSTGIEFPTIFDGSGGVIIDNTNGVSMNNNRTINTLLTFASGKVNTGTSVLTLGASAGVSGAGTGKYVNGYLQRGVTSGTSSVTYQIGDATVYAPLLINFNGSITNGGYITASTTTGDHPNIASSIFNVGVTVNRYWTLSNSGVSGFISYDATFNFVSGDIDSGADYTYFFVGNYSSGVWTYPTVGTLTGSSTQATGMIIFGDFQVGELPVASFRTRQSGNWDQASSWDSFNGSTWVPAVSTPTSAAGFITIRSGHVIANTSPITVDQVIIDAGGRLNLSSGMTINDGSGIDFKVNGTLDCTSANLTGSGSFLLDIGADIIIGSQDGITLSGASGNIQTTSRTFSEWGNYTYSGTVAQVTGDGLPGGVNNLTIDNPSGVTLTGSITSNGTVTLTNGILDAGTNSVTFENSNVLISRTNGTLALSTSSNLSFGSALNQNGDAFIIPAGTFTTPPVINNFTVERINTLTLGDQMISIAGVLLCNGPLITNGYITLLSSASETALIDGTGTGEISGNVTMQRYLPSGFGYKYISSPFQSSTVNELADDITLGNYTFYRYDESRTSSGWVGYNNPANIMTPVEGYAVNFGANSSPNTADITGAVNNGNISITLYNHNNTYTQGFNLVGNPYPSPINWNAASGWTKTNVDNALYYFRASATDQYGGTYSTYINGISSDGIVDSIIPSMQGFFVHVTDGSYPVTGTLAMDNQVRITDLTHPFAKSAKNSTYSLIRLETLYSDNQASADPLVIYFNVNASGGFDPRFDALKLFNTDLAVSNLYAFTTEGRKVSILALPEITTDSCVIPLGLKLNRPGTVTFRLRDIDESLKKGNISLTDLVNGTERDLLSEKNYSVALDKGEYIGRFFLNLNNITTSTGKIPVADDKFVIYGTGNLLKAEIGVLEKGQGMLRIYNLAGQVLKIEQVYSTGHYEYATNLMEGIYIVNYTTGTFTRSVKLFIKTR